MKKISIILAVLLFMGLPAAVCLAGPAVEVPEPVFTFAPQPEGAKIPHEFIVRNRGDAPLNITSVLPP